VKIKRWLKALLGVGAKTVVAGLQIGGGPVGGVVADILADKLGFDKNDPSFENQVLRATQSAEGRRRIMLAELEIKSRKQELFSQYELSILEASVRNFAQVQQTARTEIQSGDKYISHTRPMIIRRLFVVASIMIISLIVAVIADGFTDSWIMTNCFKIDKKEFEKSFESCLTFVDKRDSYSVRLTKSYADNWQWLSLLMGIFVSYFTGRTYERSKGVQARD